MTIRKLSSYVRSQIQSGLTITDATQCTLELVENSLDAKATAIAVRVNLSQFSIEVVDNGTGISSHDLKFVGERYMTSKCHDFDDLNNNNLITYGYKGQALASIAEICGKLTIKTKYDMNKETMLKIFRNGEPPSLSVSSKDRSDKGTTVTVHGFMCTMPVRRKRIFEVFDLQDIKNQIEYLAIIHNEVCFTLRDDNKGEILLQTHKKTDPRLSLRDLFGFASDKFFIPFNYEEKNISIQGYVSLRRHSENNLKFLYVNNRIVLKSVVHKLVDLCIDKYFKENHDILQEVPEFEGINLKLPKNNQNVYIIKIFCPYTYFVMFRNLRKTTVEFKDWDVILACVKKAIKSGLNHKSSVAESDKIDKIAAVRKRVASRNGKAVGNLKNGIKGGLVKRKVCRRNSKDERGKENSRHPAEALGAGQNNFSGYNAVSKCVPKNISESQAPGCNEATKILSESSIPMENCLDAKENSVLSDLTESVHAEKIKNMECTDFLDFLAWFRCKLKEDSKIYSDFVKYKHDFGKLKLNTCSNEARRKSLKNKSSTYKTKYKGVLKRGEEEIKKKEIRNSALVRKSGKKRNSVAIKQLGNDKIKGTTGMKRKNCAQRNAELTRKKLKVGREEGNNSSEDLLLSELQNSAQNALRGGWFSHQNRINLETQMGDVETRNSRHLKFGIDESEEEETFVMEKTNLKSKEETQVGDNVKCVSEVSSRSKNRIEYKDFGVQTDKDFVITPSNDKSNTLNIIKSSGSRCETYSSTFKDKELSGPTRFGLISQKAKASPSLLPSLQQNNMNTAEGELIPSSIVNKNIEITPENNINIFCEGTSNNLSRGTASEKLTDFPKSFAVKHTSFSCGSQSKLVHTDPLNISDINSRNRTVSLGRWSSHSNFTLTERYNFLPKGLSQSALDRSPVSDFKIERPVKDLAPKIDSPVSALNRSEGPGYKRMLPCNILGELQKKTDENMIYYEKQLISANLVNNEAEIFSLGAFTIDKEELSNITVVGQWDKKFILAIVDVISSRKKKFLAIVDQHAADERILLEKLLKEFRTCDGHFVSVCCDPPIKCTVRESVGRLLPSFEYKLVDYGIKATAVDHENILLYEIPLCFANESIPENSENFFQSLLHSVIGELNETRGTVPAIPKVYYDVISTKACKSAVKFNDVLSNSAMKKMMNDLVTCQIPFQCAHGRPCIVPILDIENYKREFKQEGSKLSFRKFSA